MSRSRLITGFSILAALFGMSAGLAHAADPNDILPEGPAKVVILRECTSCHEGSYVVAKPRTKSEWDEVVGSMMSRGANLSEDEQDKVIAYLSDNFGPTASTPKP